MPKSYITDHHGGGYQFQIAVPLDLRAFIGKKVFYHYIKRKPRREAEDEARKLAADYKYLFDVCRARSQGQRNWTEAQGGLYPVWERTAGKEPKDWNPSNQADAGTKAAGRAPVGRTNRSA